MKLYVVRHGESEANIEKIISNRGWIHGLTETGKQQAESLAERMKAIPVTRIFTSSLMRAVQTAEILAKSQGLEYTVTDALREYDCGILEGKSDEQSWQIHRQVWDNWMLRANYDSRLEGGECFHDIQQRFMPLIESIVAEYGQTDANIVLITHGGTIRTMMPLLASNIKNEFAYHKALQNTEYVVLEWQESGFTALRWGEYAF